jgi:hypothetical protein
MVRELPRRSSSFPMSRRRRRRRGRPVGDLRRERGLCRTSLEVVQMAVRRPSVEGGGAAGSAPAAAEPELEGEVGSGLRSRL